MEQDKVILKSSHVYLSADLVERIFQTIHYAYVTYVAEQQKIADCLTFLDALIAAHTEKLDALKELKKGLMQKLFPCPEAT